MLIRMSLVGEKLSRLLGREPRIYRPSAWRVHVLPARLNVTKSLAAAYIMALAFRLDADVRHELPERLAIRPGQFLGVGQDDDGQPLAHFCADYGKLDDLFFAQMLDDPVTTYTLDQQNICQAIKNIEAETVTADRADNRSFLYHNLTLAREALDHCHDGKVYADDHESHLRAITATAHDHLPISIRNKVYERQVAAAPKNTGARRRFVVPN